MLALTKPRRVPSAPAIQPTSAGTPGQGYLHLLTRVSQVLHNRLSRLHHNCRILLGVFRMNQVAVASATSMATPTVHPPTPRAKIRITTSDAHAHRI